MWKEQKTKFFQINSIVYRYYAYLHYRMDNVDKSEQLYLKSIEIDPNNAHAHYNYARLLQNKKQDFDNAKIYYQKAIDLYPNYGGYYAGMADLLCNRMHNYSESLTFSTKAVSLKTHGDYTYLVAKAYDNLKQWSLAKEYYTKTLKLANASRYGFNQKKVEAKIAMIDKMEKATSDNFWYKTI